MEPRPNQDLDDFMGDVQRVAKAKRRKPRKVTSKDTIRRHAFRVLSLLSALDAPQRERVLRMALEMNS